MFITKKHLSRRTVPPRCWRRSRLAAARCDGAGVDGAGADRGEPEAAHGIHLSAARRDHGALDARRRGRQAFELTPILKPFAPFKKQLTIVSGLENKPAIAPPVHALEPRHVAELRDAARETGSARRRDGRSDRRRAHRTGHAAARRWKLRPKDAAVAAPATATTAAATARRSRSARRPRRCRWSQIRASCSSGCSVRATRPQEREGDLEAVHEHPRSRDAGGRRPADARSTRPIAPSSATTSRPCARSSGACRRWRHRICPASICPRCPSAATLRPAAQSDVRHDRAGLPGEPDARVHLHDGRRGQQRHLQPHRRVRTRSIRCRITRTTSRAKSELVEDPDLSQPGVREVPDQARGDARRRRLGARSLDPAVRQQHEQQQRARRVPAADDRRRRRLRASSRAAST